MSRGLPRSSLLLAVALAAPMACGGGDGQSGGRDGGIDAPTGSLPDANYGDSHAVTWGPVEVAPGEEGTLCVTKRLGNIDPIKVGRIVNSLGLSSHHLIVYRVADTEERAEPYSCRPFQDVLDPTRGAPLGVTQSASETISLPPGVAFSLAADQMVRLELHFINPGTEPVDVMATATFVEIPDADFRDEADFLFVGNPDIQIAAHTAQTVGPSFLALPPELSDIHVFAITGHQHQFGTGVQIAKLDSVDDSGTTVYAPEDFDWSEPPTVYPDPPFTMASGGGFRFSCDYMNTSDDPVEFGESANDEMCFFWAYYYPSNGAKVCVHTDQVGGEGGLDACCPGNGLCSLIQDYLNTD